MSVSVPTAVVNKQVCSYNRACILKLVLLKFVLNLLWFRVYNSIIHHLYIVLCVHLLPSPFFPLALFDSPHPLFLWELPYSCYCLWGACVCVCVCVCVLFCFCLILAPFLPSLLNPLPSDRCQSVLCIW